MSYRARSSMIAGWSGGPPWPISVAISATSDPADSGSRGRIAVLLDAA
jgi:hypothetical protein